jgi:hypothetical protein
MILMRLSSSPPHFTHPATQVVKSDTQLSGFFPLSGWLRGVPTIPSKLEHRLSSKVPSRLKRQIGQFLKIDWHEREATIKQLYTQAMRLSNSPNPHNHTVNQIMRLCGFICTEVARLGKSHTLSSEAKKALAFAKRNRYEWHG